MARLDHDPPDHALPSLLSVIRRWHFREGIPIREIERRTGLSRNTIRKYLRSGTVEPKFKVPDRPSKLDPFAEKLTGWLREEAGKSRKQKRTAKQMHADLVALCFDGGYGIGISGLVAQRLLITCPVIKKHRHLLCEGLSGGEALGDVFAFAFRELLDQCLVRFAGVAADRLRDAERRGVAGCDGDAAGCDGRDRGA